MKRIPSISQALILAVALLALLPIVDAIQDWAEIADFEDGATSVMRPSARGSDWVVWEDADGSITAAYVFPNGPGARAGIQSGDEFYTLEYQQYFDAEDLSNVIAGIKPGQTRDLILVRNGKAIDVSVTFERHPTFLYPRSTGVWQFALWSFTIGAFFHVLALFIAAPLALHNRRSRIDLFVIGVSAFWIVGNMARLLLVEIFGPAVAGTLYDQIFQVLTFFSLLGWIGFPVLLVRSLVLDADLARGKLGKVIPAIYAVPFILAIAILVATVKGNVGPFTIEKLLVPILFYASCYIGATAVGSLLLGCLPEIRERKSLQWGRIGSAFILVFSFTAALAVLDVIPVFSSVSETIAAWVIVSAQLLAVVPVSLYTIGTLRYGKVDEVFNRAITYMLVIGLIFFAFTVGLIFIDAFIEVAGRSRIVIEGLYVVFLLVVFERISRRLRMIASSIFATDRHRGRQVLNRFQEDATQLLDAQALALQAIEVAGRVFDARSAIIFLRSPADDAWIIERYRPDAPYLTEQVFSTIWPFFEYEPSIWSRNPELNEHPIENEGRLKLLEFHSVLAVPIRGDGKSVGLMILAAKSRRGSVYNLEDLDQLRSLSGNLALAVDRLALVEREKSLAAESSEAHLVALRSQINPHFLFNALNTLLSLIEEKPTEAEAVVENLASIFRHTLQAGSKAFVSMEEETSLVEHYLSIEKARFGDRLNVNCELDESLKSHPVPAFAIQTVVENAIKHGLEKRRTTGSLLIKISEESEGMAKVTVADSGVGIPSLFGKSDIDPREESFFGMGLSNVYDRMRRLYGRDDLLRFSSDPEKGTTVTILIPEHRV